MKTEYKNTLRKRIILLLLICYTMLWATNIFHHHHIIILDADIITEQPNNSIVSHVYSYDQNLSCTVHSNYVSISSLKISSTFEILPEPGKDALRIGIEDFSFSLAPFLELKDLRAPPLS